MNTTLYFYSHLDCKELQLIVEKYQAWLDDELHRLFDLVEDDQEGAAQLKMLDQWSEELGAAEVHPIHDELSFDDLNFEADSLDLTAQQQFFSGCRSSVVWQHLADFHTNPLQVSAVKYFCELHPEVLIDGDLDDRLYFGHEYRAKLATQFKDSAQLITPTATRNRKPSLKVVMDDNPIELRLKKITQKLAEMSGTEKLEAKQNFLYQWPELEKLYSGIETQKTQDDLRVYSELGAKAYTDGIERIFLFLKK